MTDSLPVALALGLGFGFFLERGGMGNARKLAGQFYLTDWSVLKVMFSAIVTAMLGLFWLGWLGVVDRAAVFVPPTWLGPQLLGGAVFGVGFVMGGLCPGTSCVALSTGRMDGLAVAAGMLTGVGAFAELSPRLERLHHATAAGTITLPDVLRLPEGWVVCGVVLAAIGAFAVAERLERRRARA